MPAHRTRGSLSLPSAGAFDATPDAPQPPRVSIVAPTPRAFTFPANIQDETPRAFTFPANVQDTPIGDFRHSPSPCVSPFEPDLGSLEISGSTRTDSPAPLSPLRAVESSMSASSHHRRGSACSSTERKPKKGDEDYIKRPENAFILFRRDCCMKKNAAEAAGGANDSPSQRRQRQADLSKTISQQWKSLPAEERAYWDELAKQRKKEHEEAYPWYVYQPSRSKSKVRKASSKTRKDKGKSPTVESDDFEVADTDESESVVSSSVTSSSSVSSFASYVLPNGRRASSAPTPPPTFPNIRLPSLPTPSCPNSPALNALARSQGKMLAPDMATHLSFFPNDSLSSLPSSYGAMDPSGQVPDFSNMHPASMFPNAFEVLSQSSMSDSGDSRTYPGIAIPRTPPRHHLMLHQESPTPSIASSGPSTPLRQAYGYPSSYHQSSLHSPTSPSKLSHSEVAETQKHQQNQAPQNDLDSFGLPDWAMPTLWPNMDSNFSTLNEGGMDVSSIPPLSLDFPPHHHESDLLETMTDPLFGLQFRFEDLLDPSQL
ncbi:hypothetical protein BD410DRAFT_785326 [Rickenella mellea]|uniref:HMG box domain-containing protein n=1 Tax=Rickenella mellea TaxID=50990 RepID=A0A4Y7QDC0_9AGAM|nr:hypothetical protein BD410DRAFT_785326 [Rickenella mellea]